MRQIVPFALFVLASACQREAPPADTAAAPPPAPREAGTKPEREHRFEATINAADFAQHVKTLSSDEFEGRAPGSLGERLTVTYLQSEFERLGLKPGNGDSYVQSVPMVETRTDPKATLVLEAGGQMQPLRFGDDMVVGTRSGKQRVEVRGAELVFAGYGVNAPEHGWNDYEGLDVKGKTVVVLINDPGFIRKDETLFKGRAMTYYGRWTYKFEEAARQGAAGCLIIHEPEAAAYGWEVVRNSWGGAQFDLPPSEDKEPRLEYEGWISGAAAEALFLAAGHDFHALRLAADARGFKPLALGAKASVALDSVVRAASSDNVLALLPGSEQADQVVVYMAHWDHLPRAASAADGDTIFNGAIDNATGVAAVLEIAEAFARHPVKPKRSVLFLVPTLEESGLLGSRYYANHPVYPLAGTVAVINMDALPVRGRTRDMAVIGHGQSNLEAVLADVLKAQDRVITPEATPEKGFYFRSDHFNFARKGVPALYARAGFDVRDGGVAAGVRESEDYTNNRYHKTADEFDPSWDLSGVIEDVQALHEVGRRIAAGDVQPAWREDSEFRAAGEARLADHD
jgi:Zn-dependent M28 family amino/carboxypeptidase